MKNKKEATHKEIILSISEDYQFGVNNKGFNLLELTGLVSYFADHVNSMHRALVETQKQIAKERENKTVDSN